MSISSRDPRQQVRADGQSEELTLTRRLVQRHPLSYYAGAAVALAAGPATARHVPEGSAEAALALCQLVLMAGLFGSIRRLGWWRETGLRWRRPNRRWCLVLPAAGLCLTGTLPAHTPTSAVLACGLGFTSAVVHQGVGHFVLRRFGPWRSTLVVAVLSGAVYGTAGEAVAGMALAFALTAARPRLATLWPVILLQVFCTAFCTAFSSGTAAWPGRLVAVAGLVAYGCLLLHRQPTVDMSTRPTVRVVCLDESHRVLLLRWYDPFDGTYTWELPGGGIAPGESPLQAARRELGEETGLAQDSVYDRRVLVPRDSYWNGRRYRGVEPAYLGRTIHPPPLSRSGLEPVEARYIRGYDWVDPKETAQLPGRIQTVGLRDIVRRLQSPDHDVR
ncbi:NUDIX domain-containing protein [Streptomyces sp. NPDC048484]|uniref:NUDIX domain-containing protein n=1 Tax=Streptomyces sp. NPDC048484 TaxID=3155146 RepID=UPI003447BC62